jgi:heptosyltransferase-2
VRCLKKQVEGAEIHFLTKKQYAPIVENNPYIDKVHVFEGNIPQLLKELKFEFFDHIIDLHHNLRSYRIKNNLPVYAQAFPKLNWEKWLLVNLKINKMPKVHIVDRYMSTTRFFETVNDHAGLDYFIPEADEVDISKIETPFSTGYILFAIGAQHATKRLPTEKIISICKKLGKPIILAGGKDDFETGEKIRSAVGKTVFNSCGSFSLNQSASLVRQSQCVITHDTGLMHIAAAFKKKIISVWGNTVPEFGMYPYLPGENSVIVQVENLKCRPCSKIGFPECPKKHFKCMNEINENKIIKAC